MKVIQEFELGGRKLTLETGELARRATAAVLGRLGETIVLATVCYQPSKAETDFLPLTVDYEERLYAGGRISTSRFIKREGRPPVEAILADRLIDRTIRPLFDPYFNDEVQVIITVLSYDRENDHQILAAVTASAALMLSGLAWAGPVGTVRVGRIKNEFILNPTEAELQFSDFDLIISAAPTGIIMIETQAQEVDEKVVAEALAFGEKFCLKICQNISQMAKKVGAKVQLPSAKPARSTVDKVKNFIKKNYLQQVEKKGQDDEWFDEVLGELFEKFEKDANKFVLRKILEDEVVRVISEKILVGKRLDGRKPDDIRPVTARVGLLARTHGSALFSRGETQVLSVVTLGSPALEQLIEGMSGEETKRYIHHYNFPPFTTGEVRRIGSPRRREIGHGSLAEKALLPVIPIDAKFPYTIRVVSEVLSSAGSTSMASVCGSSLALMDAGVPITAPVAGISIGSFSANGKRVLITDIAYQEDSAGEMDFKVAGTERGVTAIQMDLKISGFNHQILAEALEKAKVGRLSILSQMSEVLAKSREKISPFAPKVKVLHIAPSQIGEVIGSGGRVIRQIMTQTGTVIDVEDDGTISVSGSADEASTAKAVSLIEAITRKPVVGEVFEGVVKKILPFGAMVEFLPGREGLVHISNLAPFRVENISDVVRVGQNVKVRVAEVDSVGRINLSMRFGETQKTETQRTFTKNNRGFKKRF